MKLQGQNIIILGLPRFDAVIESTNYTIAKLLAAENNVYYIEHPHTIKDYLRLREAKEENKREGYFSITGKAMISTPVPNMKVIVPPVLLSINFLPEGVLFRLALRFNEFLIRTKLKGMIKEHNIKDFIFINSFNFHYPDVIDGLNPKLTVYHCVDPIVVPFDARHGVVSEDKLVTKSDVILCTSRALYNNCIQKNKNTFFVPNAADITHSQTALDENLPVSSILKDFPKPVIGYFGNIERRMDYALLGEVAGNNPDKSFVFVGPQDRSYIPDSFFEMKNVYFTGSVAYKEMPAVLKGFDVALLPFKRDEVSNTIFPLKLFEYLGAGKPLVAINFNDDLADFTGDTVAYCSDAASFSSAITKALETNSEEKKLQRIQIARNNTWQVRITQIADILANALELKREKAV